MNLLVDWCSHAAAKHAVMNWHYSRTMPAGKNVYLGVWEDNSFRGAIIFGSGGGDATNGTRFGLRESLDVVELVRVALRSHQAPVSKMIAFSIRKLRKQLPGIRLIVSYADPYAGHVGKIYQAGGWVYLGRSGRSPIYYDHSGKKYNSRVVSKKGKKMQFGKMTKCLTPTDMALTVRPPAKFLYAYPLDSEVRTRLQAMALPYPKSVGSAESGTPVPTGGSGAIPTPTLQTKAADDGESEA